ncbi:MAG: hypothetical protein AB7P76_02595 [Candidatus Melainabacteria bacterium]
MNATTLQDGRTFRKPMTQTLWWACFAAATVVLSLCFQQFKNFTLQPTAWNGFLMAGVLLLLTVLVMLMIYDGYVQERLAGNVRHPFGLFEAVLIRQYGADRVAALPVDRSETPSGDPT